MAENELTQLFGGREDLVNIALKCAERNEEN